jgi:ribosomal protein S8
MKHSIEQMQQEMATKLRHDFQTKFDQIDQKLDHDNKLLKIEFIKEFEKASQHTNNIETKITTQLANLRDSSNLFETLVAFSDHNSEIFAKESEIPKIFIGNLFRSEIENVCPYVHYSENVPVQKRC